MGKMTDNEKYLREQIRVLKKVDALHREQDSALWTAAMAVLNRVGQQGMLGFEDTSFVRQKLTDAVNKSDGLLNVVQAVQTSARRKRRAELKKARLDKNGA